MKVKASFSVEAALIMPFIFLVVIFMVQTGLFMCDCCIAETFLYESLNDKELVTDKSFFVSEYTETEVDIGNTEIRAEAVLKMKNGILDFIGEKKISLCLFRDTPVKNAHSARAVRKVIKNLYIIVKGD